ncbi:MAG: homoserine dehydrogenase [Dehalococcoidia bacterium]|nr:homoserine dehydrogenase [Dehalococcoidia bacterium]
MKAKRVAVAGFGNVGKGVIEILLQKQIPELKLAKIVVKHPDKSRPFNVDPELVTTDFARVVHDPEIDIVVEVMGGVEDARSLILDALQNGKDIVTANKAIIARGNEVFSLAAKLGRTIGFRGTFVGCNTLIHDLSLSAGRIRRMCAILNGTCNYILSHMSRRGIPFEQALKEAQEQGYAEADASDDIDGIDTARKIQILSGVINNTFNMPPDVPCEGIREITMQDIQYGRELGYAIKLVGIVEKGKDSATIFVRPVLVPHGSLLASVEDANNAIELEDDLGVVSALVAPGAGTYPTAVAIINDLLDIAHGDTFMMPTSNTPIVLNDTGDIETRYYLRLTVIDQPGVLAQITRILGDHNISLASIIQKEAVSAKSVSVIVTTYLVREKELRAALQQIDLLEVVKAKTRIIQILA